MKPLHVACSQSGQIFAGSVTKKETWGINKTDVTGKACGAVALHCMLMGGDITISMDGIPKFQMVVTEIKDVPEEVSVEVENTSCNVDEPVVE